MCKLQYREKQCLKFTVELGNSSVYSTDKRGTLRLMLSIEMQFLYVL